MRMALKVQKCWTIRLNETLTSPFSITLQVDRFSEAGPEYIFIEPSENSADKLCKNDKHAKRPENSTARHFCDGTESDRLIKAIETDKMWPTDSID